MAKSKSFGTQLQLGDGAPSEAFTTVAHLTNIDGPEHLVGIVQTLAHDTADGYEEHIDSGVRRFNEIPIEGHWDPASATHDGTTGLRKKAETAGPHNWKIIWPDASTTTVSFAASLVRLKFGDAPLEGALPFSGALQISGKPTWS